MTRPFSILYQRPTVKVAVSTTKKADPKAHALKAAKAKEIKRPTLKKKAKKICPLETKLAMCAYLGELVLSNDVKVVVARRVGFSLVNVMRSGNLQSREAALKGLNHISSSDASAKVLIEAGILPHLSRTFSLVVQISFPRG
ncbi:hypothetical protein IFM89_030898 [Coptis chinensis]|uniref:Uncharacterized protein n=1 Tax=Coptis chinensis TaxID=261450 RepID=A0A835HYI3_9MAGN|nr:hypothetical protein IFM89_030898 [Coptis chinensis]